MNKVLKALEKASRLGLLICAITYVGLYIVARMGSIGGEILPVLSRITLVVMTIIAVGSIALLLLLKKEEAAKIVFTIVAGYWLISNSASYLTAAEGAVDGNDGLFIVTSVVGFVVGLSLTAVLVLLVLHFIMKKEILRLSALFTMAGAITVIFVLFVLNIVKFAKYSDFYDWTSYVYAINSLVAPVGVCFGYLYFFGTPLFEERPAPQKEEAPKQEEPQPEQPQEVEQEEKAE